MKRAWDMPTSQSNSVLETWIHADFSRPIRGAVVVSYWSTGYGDDERFAR
jgi:hypothetical protein